MSTTSPSAASIPELTARLQKMQANLAAQKRSATSSLILMTLLGLLALAALASYFAYGYFQFVEVTKPKNVVAMAETQLEELVPQLRTTLEGEINKSAPEWAESLSKQAQGSLPSLRTKFEDYVLEQVDAVAGQVAVITEEQFRKYLRDHHDALENGFQELATSPELAEESLNRLTESLEAEFRANMQSESEEMFGTLVGLNTQLKKLRDGKGLNEEDELERRILRMARRMQLEQADPNGAGRLKTAESKPIPKMKSQTAEVSPETNDASKDPATKPATGDDEPKPVTADTPAEEAKKDSNEAPEAAKPEVDLKDGPKDEPKPEASDNNEKKD